jgi:hypothetical protein
MGIPKAAPVRRRVQGRDLSAVPDQEFVRNQLTEFANAKATRPETKFKITKFLEGAPDEQLEMFGPRGGMPKTPKATRTEPTERRRDAEPQRSEPAPSGVGVQTGGRDTEVGRTPEEVRDTERAEPPRPDRLERAERDVADVADREGALPSALEKPKETKTARELLAEQQRVKQEQNKRRELIENDEVATAVAVEMVKLLKKHGNGRLTTCQPMLIEKQNWTNLLPALILRLGKQKKRLEPLRLRSKTLPIQTRKEWHWGYLL